MLSACSPKQQVIYESRTEVLTTPDTLLSSPCKGIQAGDTVGSLARGYVVNTNCLAQYERLLIKQREYKKNVEEQFNGSTKQ